MSDFDFQKLLKEIPAGTKFDVILFTDYIVPNGFLGTAPEEHGLFFYYLNARRTYEEHVLDSPIIMDDQSSPEYDFRQLFESIAGLYGCKPEEMANAWDTIDKQCQALNLPLMPDEPKYRFAISQKIIIQ